MPSTDERAEMRVEANTEPVLAPDEVVGACGLVVVEQATVPTLVSLAVEGAIADGDRWWTVVNPAGAVNVIATTEPMNTKGEWRQITWTGGGATQVLPNIQRVIPVAVQDNVLVNAVLNGPVQSIALDIFDLTDLSCNMRIQTHALTWKDYAGYAINDPAMIRARTAPNEERVWLKLNWAPAGAPGLDTNDQCFAADAVGDIDVAVSLGGKTINALLRICQWPVLAVDTIYFMGGHVVDFDTLGGMAARWSWTAAQQNVATQELDITPLCFTRDTDVTLMVHLYVSTPPTDPETVTVRGTATLPDGTDIVWTSGPITVNPGDPMVSFPAAVAGDAPLPDEVEFYDPFTIEWEMSDPNGAWIDIGTTQHRIYTTLNDPAGTPVYWTLLHYSCIGAAGATTDQELVTGSWTPLSGLAISRMRDNVPLSYWDPPGTPQTGGANGSTALMLAEPTGHAHCGAWAEFLIDCWKVHGLDVGHKVNVTRNALVQLAGVPPTVLPATTKRGFLVSWWQFDDPPQTSANDLTHSMGTDLFTNGYAPGQNNVKPPYGFYNHFVVFCTTDNRIYDPSYGHDFASPADWEPVSIAGLFATGTVPDSGYSPVGGVRLLQFRDLVTNANLP